jgi:hypothetical protein
MISGKWRPSAAHVDEWLVKASTIFWSISASSTVDATLLFIFIAHVIILESISVEERAQPPVVLHPKLTTYISETFLPLVFLATESAISGTCLIPQIDGRIFICLIRCFLSNVDKQMDTVIGERTYQHAFQIWSSSSPRNAKPDVIKLKVLYELPQSLTLSETRDPPFKLLPFSNEVFDRELSSVKVETEDHESASLPRGHLQFGPGVGTVFTDTQHWHNNSKAILPRHLGGEDPIPLDEWKRRRLLRSAQRFMVTLQRQAETLAVVEPIRISPVGTKASPGNSLSRQVNDCPAFYRKP